MAARTARFRRLALGASGIWPAVAGLVVFVSSVGAPAVAATRAPGAAGSSGTCFAVGPVSVGPALSVDAFALPLPLFSPSATTGAVTRVWVVRLDLGAVPATVDEARLWSVSEMELRLYAGGRVTSTRVSGDGALWRTWPAPAGEVVVVSSETVAIPSASTQTLVVTARVVDPVAVNGEWELAFRAGVVAGDVDRSHMQSCSSRPFGLSNWIAVGASGRFPPWWLVDPPPDAPVARPARPIVAPPTYAW